MEGAAENLTDGSSQAGIVPRSSSQAFVPRRRKVNTKQLGLAVASCIVAGAALAPADAGAAYSEYCAGGCRIAKYSLRVGLAGSTGSSPSNANTYNRARNLEGGSVWVQAYYGGVHHATGFGNPHPGYSGSQVSSHFSRIAHSNVFGRCYRSGRGPHSTSSERCAENLAYII